MDHLLLGQLATIETPQDAEERLAAFACAAEKSQNEWPRSDMRIDPDCVDEFMDMPRQQRVLRIHHLNLPPKPMILGYARDVVDPPPISGTFAATFHDSALLAEISNPTIEDMLSAIFPFPAEKLTPTDILRRVGELCQSNRRMFWDELSREVEKTYGPTPGGYSREAWAAEHGTDRNFHDAYDRVVGDDRP